MDYFKKLSLLLQAERDADQQAFAQLTATTTVAQRRANGLSWYPVAIRGTEIGAGDYLTIELERTTHSDLPHQLRFGVAAALFSNHNSKEDRLEGIVSWQGGDRLKLSLRIDELPDWADDGKLGVDLLFDDNSYNEMRDALQQADAKAEKREENRLIRVLTGEAPATFLPALPYTANGLNESQQAAVNKILEAQELAVIHGPPGTGKTTTLVQAIKALWQQDERQLLVVAPSNTAVDLLSEKLSEAGLNVLRVGNPVKVSPHLTALTPDARLSAHPGMKEVKKLRKQAAAFRDMAHKYKRHFGKAEREQRKALFDEARKIMKDVANTEQYMMNDLLHKAQVITATPVGANHYSVRQLRYHTVVIDEAGQALEPACWIPVLKAEKLVLAGDHLQLPPTIKSAAAAQDGLADTLLEKCVRLHPEAVVLLEEQYRMNTVIMGYSSAVFYEQRLKAHASVAGQRLFPGAAPLLFIDTAGCGFEEEQDGGSTVNKEEAAFLMKLLAAQVAELGQYYNASDFPTIAVVSPYRQQVQYMQELQAQDTVLAPYAGSISVNTIDSFQGQERDVVYISMTRSNTEGSIGFLSDTRRMNVAMTRARKQLVVIGDSATLAQHPFYAGFQDFATANDGYKSAWEYM